MWAGSLNGDFCPARLAVTWVPVSGYVEGKCGIPTWPGRFFPHALIVSDAAPMVSAGIKAVRDFVLLFTYIYFR